MLLDRLNIFLLLSFSCFLIVSYTCVFSALQYNPAVRAGAQKQSVKVLSAAAQERKAVVIQSRHGLDKQAGRGEVVATLGADHRLEQKTVKTLAFSRDAATDRTPGGRNIPLDSGNKSVTSLAVPLHDFNSRLSRYKPRNIESRAVTVNIAAVKS
jgi:hypothetical protein